MRRGLTIRDRVEVHRSVERLRASGIWPDELDFQDDAIGALQALSDEIAFDAMQEQQQQLLVSELRRELRRHLNLAESVDHSPDATVQTILHPDLFGRPAGSDPIGELGGREGPSQLHFRPQEGRVGRAQPRQDRGGDIAKRQWSSDPLPEGVRAGWVSPSFA